MAPQLAINTRYFGKSALERLYSSGASVTSTSSGLTNYTATNAPVDISPILSDAMTYDYKLLSTNTAPYVYWNTGMVSDKMVFDEVHHWNEDTLYSIGENMDYSDLTAALADAVAKGWITDDEAKTEIRNAFPQTRYADQVAKQKADRIENLKKALADEEASA